MKKIRGTFLSIPVLLLANAPALWKLIDINSLLKTLIIILLALYTLGFLVQITWAPRFSWKNPTA